MSLGQEPTSCCSTKTEVVFWWSCVVVATVVTVAHNWHIRPWMLDDAFISFRYSENWTKGLGLVYNAGERVEGYTSFLWVILLGCGNRMGFDTVILSRVLAALFAGLTILLLAVSYRLVSSVTRTAAALAVLFLGTCGVFTPWLSSGMEVNLFAFLIMLTVLVCRADLIAWPMGGRSALSALCCGLAMLTRPEGILIAALLAAPSAYRLIRHKDRSVLLFGAILILIYVPYFIWRFAYYGFIFPNTFYVKVGFTFAQLARGWSYGSQALLVCAPMIALAMVSLLRRSNRNSSFLFLVLTSFVLQFVYVILVGGDCMPAFRFVAPALPFLALAAATGAASVAKRWALLAVLAMITCGYNLYQMSTSPAISDHIRNDLVAYQGKAVGLWLKDHELPSTVLATNTAGSVAYYSQLRIIDMLGLNDVHIAHKSNPTIGTGLAGHEGADGAYVLSRLPDLVQFGSALGSESPRARGDSELFVSPAFQSEYSVVGVPIKDLKCYAIFYSRIGLRFPDH